MTDQIKKKSRCRGRAKNHPGKIPYLKKQGRRTWKGNSQFKGGGKIGEKEVYKVLITRKGTKRGGGGGVGGGGYNPLWDAKGRGPVGEKLDHPPPLEKENRKKLVKTFREL